MDDSSGCMVIILMTVMAVVLSLNSCTEGIKQGRLEGECTTRAEFALTGEDTLKVAQKYPKCRDILFPTETP